MADPTDLELLNHLIVARTIRRAVFLEQHKLYEVRRILDFLEGGIFSDMVDTSATYLARIRSRGPGVFAQRQWKSLLERLDEISGTGYAKAHTLLREGAVELARAEAAWQMGLTSPVLEVSFTRPADALIRKAVTSRPFQGKLLREWSKELDRNTRARVMGQIREGIMAGESTDQMVRRLVGRRATGYTDGVLQTSRREAEMVVRTATQHVVSQARQETYKANTMVKAVRWVATLDSTTCPTCGGLDGREWDPGKGPRPPAHPFCRCSTIPVYERRKIPGLNFDRLPPRERATINGPVLDQDFGTWLKGQSLADQKRVLGVRGAELFRSGKVPIRKFSDAKLQPRRLEELEQIAASST